MKKHMAISSVGYSRVRRLLGCVCIAILPNVVAQSFEEHAQRMNERFEAFQQEKQQEHASFTHLHRMEVGSVVPKHYRICELDLQHLVFKDDFGKVLSFDKAE